MISNYALITRDLIIINSLNFSLKSITNCSLIFLSQILIFIPFLIPCVQTCSFLNFHFFYCSLQHYLSKLFFIFFLHLNYFFFFFFLCTDNQIFLIKVSSTYLLLLPFTCKYEVKKNRSCYNHLSLIIIDSIGLNTAAHIFE